MFGAIFEAGSRYRTRYRLRYGARYGTHGVDRVRYTVWFTARYSTGLIYGTLDGQWIWCGTRYVHGTVHGVVSCRPGYAVRYHTVYHPVRNHRDRFD